MGAACIAFAILLASGARTRAQVQPEQEITKTAEVVRTTDTLIVDGVLDEAAWTAAQVIADFVQQEPNVNQPASERTEVRVLVDGSAFYFGITCTQATRVIARERRRDNLLADDDRFEIVLDTFHDHRNAYKPSSIVSVETSYEMNDVSLPQGAFTTHVVNARLNVNPSNRWLTTTLAQYDSASHQQIIFARVNYIYRPGDDVFLVVNRTDERGSGKPVEYTVLLKMTYSLDF